MTPEACNMYYSPRLLWSKLVLPLLVCFPQSQRASAAMAEEDGAIEVRPRGVVARSVRQAGSAVEPRAAENRGKLTGRPNIYVTSGTGCLLHCCLGLLNL